MKNILLYILLLICLKTFAQPYDQKFGKISMAEMEMKVCPIDSSAAAVVLFDIGETKFEYNTMTDRFELMISRHVRIKVLTKDGLNWANTSLYLYHKNRLEEKLNSFKGFTYNLIGGKIQKDKVEKDCIFREEKDDNRTIVKITFPKVVEGSVIEYQYEIISGLTYSLEPWSFQYSIPVLLSQFTVGIPEYYQYNTHISGYESVDVQDKSGYRTVVITGTSKTQGPYYTQNKSVRNEFKYYEKLKIFTAQNVPAYDNDAYVDNIDNYLSKVYFELAFVRFPGELQENYTTSWEEINKNLLDDSDFGKQLDRGSYLRDDLQAYIGSIDKPEEKLVKTISFIKDKIKWDNKYRLYTDIGVKEAYRNKVGNSSEVNLNLVIALREVGLEAYPVILSTRSHGLVMEWQKTISGFNHVVACTKIGDKFYYSDATSPFNMYNVLPTECLNGQARLIDLKNGSWVDLKPQTVSRESVYATLKIDNSTVTGKVEASYKDYYAQYLAEMIKGDDSLKHRKEKTSKSFNNANIDSLRVKFGENGIPEAKEYYQLKMEDVSQGNIDIIYLSPLLGFTLAKTPFAKPERKFPVNFTFPQDESILVRYSLPKNYKVDEMPSNAAFSMPDGKAKFTISYNTAGNELVIKSKITIPNTIYISTDYPALRGFFDEVLKKQNEKIILKKI